MNTSNKDNSQDLILSVFHVTEIAMCILDDKNFFFEVNDAFCKMFGYNRNEIINKSIAIILSPENKDIADKLHQEPINNHINFSNDFLFQGKDGIPFNIHISSQIMNQDENKSYIYASFTDITKRKEAEEKLLLATKVFDNTIEGVIITDAEANILQVNNSFARMTGLTKDESIGKKPSLFRSGWHDDEFYDNMWKHIRENNIWQGEIWDRRKDGELFTVWETIITVKNNDEEITNYIGILSDITERKRSEKKIKHLAYYDDLTDLPNRNLLLDRLHLAIKESERTKNNIAVMFLDLDDFKKINDSLGHHIGDILLKNVAERMKSCIRKYDTISRQGGDEFIIVLPEISESFDASIIATKIIDALSTPFKLEKNNVFTSTSIGISIYPDDGNDSQTLMKNADIAMYSAKKTGKNNYKFFTEKMNKNALEKLVLDNHLRFAIQREEFVLRFQPQTDIWENKITSAEALVRWDRPKHGIIPPINFIQAAESTGLIIELGEWILKKACQEQVKWTKAGFSSLYIAVNISLIQLKHNNFVKMVSNIINETGINPVNLELEITESFFMDDPENSIKKIWALKDMGVQIAIDDFGTGYSSLNYLKHLPIDKLKIDKSFIDELITNPDDRAIVSSIISMAHYLNLEVIAEGVTTEKQLYFLKENRCNMIQGYYFHKPLTDKNFFDLIRRNP